MIDTDKLKLEPIIPNNYKRRTFPMAAIGHNTISFNKEASENLDITDDYCYVEISHGEYQNKMLLLFRFLKDRSRNSFKVSFDKRGRISVCNKELATSIFGTTASGKTRRLDDIIIDNEQKLVQINI